MTQTLKMTKPSELGLDVGLLAIFFWCARYWHSIRFGFYEDDWTIIPDATSRSLTSLLEFVGHYVTGLRGHGRPLSNSFIYLFSWLGWRINGLEGIYLLGFLITTLNVFLFYLLLRRTADRTFALVSGLAFVLYSADTTQAYLTHSLGLQPSVTLLLLAAHSYLSNRRLLAYCLGFVILFSYETPYLLMLALPLLRKPWDKSLVREIVWNSVIVLALLTAAYVFRLVTGEGRVAGLGLRQMLTVPITHMLEGPFVSLGTYAYRPVQVLQGFSVEIALVVVVSFLVLAYILSRLQVAANMTVSSFWHGLWHKDARRDLPEPVRMIGRMAATGAALLVLAYPLTFTVRAFAVSGRSTRVHAAGAAGAAMLVGCAVYLLLVLVHKRGRWFANILLAGYFAVMLGYGFVIQRDYVRAWQYQKDFWAQLLPLISDAGPGNAILVEPSGLKDTRQIGANLWNLPRVLMQLFVFPPDDRPAPQVSRLRPGWERSLGGKDSLLVLNQVTGRTINDVYGKYPSTDVIFVETRGGELVRRTAPLILDGKEYPLKPITDPVLARLATSPLYGLLMGDQAE